MDQLRLGDNVVWHVDDLDDYRVFADSLAETALANGARVLYIRFGKHPPITQRTDPGLRRVELDPSIGFEAFSAQVNELAREEGEGVYYLFDSLSELVGHWDTEEMLANFFQTACPYLYQLRTIAYFALLRGRHHNQTVARIYNTTQVFVELFHGGGERYLRLIKVWDRYSPEMFVRQRLVGNTLQPAYSAGNQAQSDREPSATPSSAPWESVHHQLRRAAESTQNGDNRGDASIRALKEEFARMLLGRPPEFDSLAERFLELNSLLEVRERLIGSGRIGGKATGMLLARGILEHSEFGLDDPSVLDEHDSWYIGSDVYYTFLVQNDLFHLYIGVTRGNGEGITYEEIQERFLTGEFSPGILQQIRSMLGHFGRAPIIVRSSSLLEDSFEGAFAGKYRSEFCPNQGDLDTRVEELTKAIKLVYASSLAPDALSYRRRRNLESNEELMAILVQRVSGTQFRQYFFPTLAGVALSRNLYVWNDRIDPNRGVIRLVFGLGTRAVDRVGRDYPRMIAVSHPLLRPEVGTEAAKYSQHEVDVIDLDRNEMVTIPARELLREGNYPGQNLLVSMLRDGHLEDPFSRFLNEDMGYVLTFNNLLRRTSLVAILGEILHKLSRAYDREVDIEFTAHLDERGNPRINLLQCRPLWTLESTGVVAIPQNIPKPQLLFRANRVITGGVVDNIRCIVYIDPDAYAAIDYPPDKRILGRVVGRINSHPQLVDQALVFMGPGRWGSRNIDLGVNVSYADIDNASVLVELSSKADDHDPELSFGTHFFLDLVEEQIIYLPVFPEHKSSDFHHQFFRDAPNHLTDYLPDCAPLAHLIKVIDFNRLPQKAKLLANPEDQKAVCFLDP